MKKKLRIKRIWIILFFTLICCSISFYGIKKIFLVNNNIPNEIKENKEEKEDTQNYHVSLIMAGDALYHPGAYKDGLQSDGTYNYDKQLIDIAPIIKKYDLAYYNQETILGGVELGLSGYPCFNSPIEVGDAFLSAGFNLVSLANNHTLDKGEKAILNSRKYWQEKEKNGIVTAGSYDSIDDKNKSHIFTKNGITFGFLAYTYGTNGIPVPSGKEYLVNVFDKNTVKKEIESIREYVDVLLVSMHWGVEYTHKETQEQIEQAKFLSDLGVDVIIGSHPHVIEPIKYINNTLVIYSLGNFISGQDGLEKRIGLLASIDINKEIKDDITTIEINDVKGDLVYTYHNGHYANYRVIPFYKLTNEELKDDVIKVKEKYEGILNPTNDERIKIGTLKEA